MKRWFEVQNLIWVLFIGFLGLSACKKDIEPVNTVTEYQKDNQVLSEYLDLPSSPYDYQGIMLPAYLGSTNILIHDNTPGDNQVTNEGATLGRVLFYDKKLSKNGTISCASCHIQEFGFSDTATLSKGFDGGLTGRHSMGLSNAKYRTNGRFFWDERAETLEDQVLMPIQDPVEMGMTLTDLVNVVDQQEYYDILFKRAFGDDEVTSDRISKALAQFIRAMVSFNSKYDQGRANHDVKEPFDNFTTQENWGKSIFNSIDKGQCGSCHSTDAMITVVSRNNGLTREPDDYGVEKTTGNPLDRGKFKAPSLRNIAVRPPYMHNGDYKSLREVIMGYSTGINWTPTLDGHLKMPGGQSAIRFNLTQEEIEALEAFLNTLTDTEFLTNKIYSDPFK